MFFEILSVRHHHRAEAKHEGSSIKKYARHGVQICTFFVQILSPAGGAQKIGPGRRKSGQNGSVLDLQRAQDGARNLKSHVGHRREAQNTKSFRSSRPLENQVRSSHAKMCPQAENKRIRRGLRGSNPMEGEVCLGKLLQFFGSCVVSRCRLSGLGKKRLCKRCEEALGDVGKLPKIFFRRLQIQGKLGSRGLPGRAEGSQAVWRRRGVGGTH